jgi:lambda repressor-like predicted transcriptional regulator
MHKEDVKASLRKQFGSLTRFELVSNLPVGSTKDVLRGRAVAQTERAIAAALVKPLHVLFPHRYEPPEGDAPSTKVDNTPKIQDAHRLCRGAA